MNRNKIHCSANWKKAQIKIASRYQKIANIRKDALHKRTNLLAKNHGTVVIEDLNVSGMMVNYTRCKCETQNLRTVRFSYAAMLRAAMSHRNPRLKTWDLIEDAVFLVLRISSGHFYYFGGRYSQDRR